MPCGLLLGCPPGPLVSWVPCEKAAWVPSRPRSACSAAACHHRALTENTIKKTFRAPESFLLKGLNSPLIFFFHSDGNGKNFLEPEKFFFTPCTCFESNFCPPRFLNLVNSPRLNCKDSPRTSSVLALNYADRMIFWSFTSWYSTTLASKLEVLSSITILSPFRVTNEDTDSRWFERVPQPLGFLRMESPIFSPKFKS